MPANGAYEGSSHSESEIVAVVSKFPKYTILRLNVVTHNF